MSWDGSRGSQEGLVWVGRVGRARESIQVEREDSGGPSGEMGGVRGPPGGPGGIRRPSQIAGRGREERERAEGSPRGLGGV